MKLSRALSSLRHCSSPQAGKWFLLRAPIALLSSSLFTAGTAKSVSRKSTRTSRDTPQGPEAPTQPPPPEEGGEHGGSPPQAPAKVAEEKGAASRLRRPSEIPWQMKVANSVHLIGRLGAPIQLGVSPDGAYTAVSILYHEKAYDLPQFWIPIVFQGDLAQIAACNLTEKDHVYVTGQLTGGSKLIDNNPETKMQVMVDSISYVLELHPETKCHTNSEGLDSTSAEVKDAPIIMQLWNDLFANPEKWWDNRSKGNKKSGQFKHKDTGQLLEINESTPEWVLSKLDTVVFSSKTPRIGSQSANARKSGESVGGYWSDLLKNPDLWWDNREDKLNGKVTPKWPDFSNKVTRQGLWLDSAPDWVLPKLSGIVITARGRWQNEAKKIGAGLTKKEESWRNLTENPDKWWDKRSNKSKPNAPDFKHKETGEALWLDYTTPKWVLDKLPPTNASNQ